jgi:hypothetical protein
MELNEETTSLAKTAKQAMDAQHSFCEQIRSAINSAFGCKVAVGVNVKIRKDHVDFDVSGCWILPKDS